MICGVMTLGLPIIFRAFHLDLHLEVGLCFLIFHFVIQSVGGPVAPRHRLSEWKSGYDAAV